MIRVGFSPAKTTKHSELTDVSTPHVLADLESAVCSETEADNKIAAAIASLATLIVAETEVYNDAAPTDWTDLDLSGTIGENAALVLLKVVTAAAGSHTVAFRKDGDTDEFYYESPEGSGNGVGGVSSVQNVHAMLLVPTSDAGVIEWKCEDTSTFVIDVIAYIK